MAEFVPKRNRSNDIPSEVRMHNEQLFQNLFQTLDFPASRNEVILQVGKVELLWTRDEPITLEDAMREIHQSVFENQQDLESAIISTIRLAYGDHSAEDGTSILRDKKAQGLPDRGIN